MKWKYKYLGTQDISSNVDTKSSCHSPTTRYHTRILYIGGDTKVALVSVKYITHDVTALKDFVTIRPIKYAHGSRFILVVDFTYILTD